ncbi:MAG: flagellar basal body rod protein FlgB, partial [Caldimonas sp.]
MLNRITDTLDFQAQALTLRSERQRLIASNIANADTPGYQAREMDFAKTLQAATAGLAGAPSV